MRWEEKRRHDVCSELDANGRCHAHEKRRKSTVLSRNERSTFGNCITFCCSFFVTDAKPVGSNWKMHEENSISSPGHVPRWDKASLEDPTDLPCAAEWDACLSVLSRSLETLTEQPSNPPMGRNVHTRVAIPRCLSGHPNYRWTHGSRLEEIGVTWREISSRSAHLVWDHKSVDSSLLIWIWIWNEGERNCVCTNLNHHSIPFLQRTSVSADEILFLLGSRDKSKTKTNRQIKIVFLSLARFHRLIIEKKEEEDIHCVHDRWRWYLHRVHRKQNSRPRKKKENEDNAN